MTAIVRLTENLSLELASRNIQVNAMRPGAINTRALKEVVDGWKEAGDTEMFEVGQRLLRGRDASFSASIERAGELAVFLASDTSEVLCIVSRAPQRGLELPQSVSRVDSSRVFASIHYGSPLQYTA